MTFLKFLLNVHLDMEEETQESKNIHRYISQILNKDFLVELEEILGEAIVFY